MNNGFGWDRLPKSFMAENTVFLLLTALVRNFYKAIIHRLDVKRFGLKATSRIKAFVFRFVSVPAKWIRTSRRYVLNIYTFNPNRSLGRLLYFFITACSLLLFIRRLLSVFNSQ